MDKYVHDIASLFAGLVTRFEASLSAASRTVRPLPSETWVYLSADGLDPELLGTDEDSNIHHWAWAMALGYDRLEWPVNISPVFPPRFIGAPVPGCVVNTGREYVEYFRHGGRFSADSDNILGRQFGPHANENVMADIGLGNRGARFGNMVRGKSLSMNLILNSWDVTMGDVTE
jgi:hypothetical protein